MLREDTPRLFPLYLLVQQDLAPRLQSRCHRRGAPCPAHSDTDDHREHGDEEQSNSHERRDDLCARSALSSVHFAGMSSSSTDLGHDETKEGRLTEDVERYRAAD